MKGINPDNNKTAKPGGGLSDVVNKGTGEAKSGGGSNSMGGGDVGKVHNRPVTSQGKEYSFDMHDGTGSCKGC